MKRFIQVISILTVVLFFIVSCGNQTTSSESDKTDAVLNEKEKSDIADDKYAIWGNVNNGKAIYSKQCAACHLSGVAGAAKIDDIERWSETASKHIDTIKVHVINGYNGKYGVMPAKGGNLSITDDEVMDAVAYIFKESGVEIK